MYKQKTRLAAANYALHSLTSIDDSSAETLEYDKQEAANEF